MGILIYSFELFKCRMGINFRRYHTLMSQQFSDAFQSRPVIQHGGGERVSQHVWRTFLQGGDLRQPLMDDALHLRLVDAHPLVAQEECLIQPQRLLIAHSDILPQQLQPAAVRRQQRFYRELDDSRGQLRGRLS